tara:strand:- start:37144 stop:37710 length:567 start_codon:yes stop_codon:yes gene_type:complete
MDPIRKTVSIRDLERCGERILEVATTPDVEDDELLLLLCQDVFTLTASSTGLSVLNATFGLLLGRNDTTLDALTCLLMGTHMYRNLLSLRDKLVDELQAKITEEQPSEAEAVMKHIHKAAEPLVVNFKGVSSRLYDALKLSMAWAGRDAYKHTNDPQKAWAQIAEAQKALSTYTCPKCEGYIYACGCN